MDEAMTLDHRSQSIAHRRLLICQIVRFDYDTGSDQRNFFQFSHEMVAGSLQPLAKDSRERSALNRTGLQRLADYPLVTESGERDLVAIGVQTDLFQPEHSRHPAGAADAGDTDPL